MPVIPFEILTLTFKHLGCRDVVQCQLVSRSWNQASVKILYSDVKLNSKNGSDLYTRTIKSAPHLGEYLEVIEAIIINHDWSMNEERRTYNLWDRYDLLNTVMNHCPNVLKILNHNPSSSFLTRLTNAGLRDRLSQLQYMSSPGTADFYNYANAVLAFKKTLTTLQLPNDVPENLFGAEAYPSLCENLDKFSCLRILEIKCLSSYFLSHYDTLIDNCKHLTNLSIHPKSGYNASIPIKFTETFRPHPKIETIECNWTIVSTEDQITYIMQKFPNLTSLTINRGPLSDDNVVKFSMNTLTKFLGYISSLKKGVISFHLNLKDCVHPWISVINEYLSTIDISISICDFPRNCESEVSTRFTGKTLSLTFRSYTDYHIELLSKIGKKVRSLALELRMPSPDNEANIDQIIALIELCPSVKHLKLRSPEKSYFSGSTAYQNFEMESLTLGNYYSDFGSLEKISFMFPNLKNLHLFICARPYNSSTITINLPYSSLDVLACSMELGIFLGREIYIRLKTDAGLQFYSATKNKLQKINEDKHRQVKLDIICRSLTKLKIDPFSLYVKSDLLHRYFI